MGPNQEFEYNKLYFVTHREWDNTKICPKRDTDTRIVKAKRRFIMKEKRFGANGIQCFVFTSRITGRITRNQSILSIPYYDLVDVQEA